MVRVIFSFFHTLHSQQSEKWEIYCHLWMFRENSTEWNAFWNFTEYLRKVEREYFVIFTHTSLKENSKLLFCICQKSVSENFSFFRMHHWATERRNFGIFLSPFYRLYCILCMYFHEYSVYQFYHFQFQKLFHVFSCTFYSYFKLNNIRLLVFLKFFWILEKRVT